MICETQSSIKIALGQAIEPAEKTAPPLAVSIISQLGAAFVDVGPFGEADECCGASWVRLCRSRDPMPRPDSACAGSPGRTGRRLASPVPAKAQWLASSTRYGAPVMMPVSVNTTPSRVRLRLDPAVKPALVAVALDRRDHRRCGKSLRSDRRTRPRS